MFADSPKTSPIDFSAKRQVLKPRSFLSIVFLNTRPASLFEALQN